MGSSPTVWRRWLAHELRRMRDDAGLSRKQVADALRSTTGKLHYIETAVVPARVRDLEEILFELYGVPEDRQEYYLQAARNAKKKGWWESHAQTVPKWFSLYLGLEQGASEIYTWETQLVPGLLQTREYAECVVRGGTAELDEEEVQRRLDVRMTRQRILTGPEAIRLWVILDEPALRRSVGSTEVMREQTRHILELAHRPKITVQLMPNEASAHPGMLGGFSILGFPASSDPGLIYLEHRIGALYLEQPEEIKEHQIAFEHMRMAALRPEPSLRRLEAIIEELS